MVTHNRFSDFFPQPSNGRARRRHARRHAEQLAEQAAVALCDSYLPVLQAGIDELYVIGAQVRAEWDAQQRHIDEAFRRGYFKEAAAMQRELLREKKEQIISIAEDCQAAIADAPPDSVARQVGRQVARALFGALTGKPTPPLRRPSRRR